MKSCFNISILIAFIFLISCSSDNGGTDPDPECPTDGYTHGARDFKMGFTSWPYGPDASDVEDTYDFIEKNADIFVEHIDNNIPWDAWINDTALPTEFTNEIAFKNSNKIGGHSFLLSVSVLNIDRDDLANDFDGQPPFYDRVNDPDIIDAYEQHIKYLITELSPDYLVISIESNEFRINSPEQWNDYVLMIDEVTDRVKMAFPSLPISESTTLHNLYDKVVADDPNYTQEIFARMTEWDFVAMSYYPFFQGLETQSEVQQAFDFLHQNVSKPIAFVETSTIAEDLVIDDANIHIDGDRCSQKDYLEVLLNNAQSEDYEFVIWWAHRDFDELWETFPDEVKNLGKIWRDTGLLDEDGAERPAFHTWSEVFGK